MRRASKSLRLLWPRALWFLLPALVVGSGCRQELTLDQRQLFQQALQESRSPSPPAQLRAALVYQELRDQGALSVELLFNQANAYRRAGQAGRAIAGYRTALRWNPRDPRVRHNLDRLLASQGLQQEGGVAAWLLRNFDLSQWLGLNELLFGGCSLLVAAACVAWLQVLVKRSSWGWVACLLALGAGLFLATHQLQSRRMRRGAEAVVVSPQAELKTGPAAGFEVAASGALIEGQSVNVIQQEGEWLHVRTHQGLDGWLPGSEVVAY